MQKRPITHIFVINPPGLGKQRRESFDAQFKHWQKALPPRTYFGVNKNCLDLSNWKYRHLVRDDRLLWNRLKLRWGFQPCVEHFAQQYGTLFGDRTPSPAIIEIGHIACTISHVKVLERISHFPADELCMVVEDKALINPAIEFNGIAWPEEAAFLHLWPGSINRYEKYSDDYVKILKKWSVKEGVNWTTLGYIVTPAGARDILSDVIPIPVNRTVDIHILYGGVPGLFAVRKPWVRPFFTASRLVQSTPVPQVLARIAAYHLQFLLPASFLARHPNLAKKQVKPQFDSPRLD